MDNVPFLSDSIRNGFPAEGRSGDHGGRCTLLTQNLVFSIFSGKGIFGRKLEFCEIFFFFLSILGQVWALLCISRRSSLPF